MPKPLNKILQPALYRGIQRRHAVRVLPTLPEQEQQRFRASVERNFHGALTLGLRRRDDGKTASISATWLINGKAESREALARRTQLQGAPAEEVLARLRTLRGELARRSIHVPTAAGAKAHRAKLASLREQENRLVRLLGELTLGESSPDDPWISLKQIQDALPHTGVLINIARFDVFDFHPNNKRQRWRPARYTAWVIRRSGHARIVDLGAADAVDRAIRDARQTIQDGAKQAREQGEPAAQELAHASLRRLAKMVFDPLLPHVGDSKHLVISPDGQLWLAPWTALPLINGKYAIEQFEISHVVSGRELVGRERKPTTRQAPLVFADPEFDSNSPDDNRTSHNDAVRRSAKLSEIPTFARLRATAVEARAIAPSIEQFAGMAPKVFLGNQAQESVFNSARSPRVLTLSTHGFFLKDQQVKHQEPQFEMQIEPVTPRSSVLTVDGKHFQNPMLRCGLVLAGCNNRGQVASDGEDGVLTGLEIVGANLRGTELVVLSACETGVGEVRNGEGVAGLRQAFQLAGAETVVASLWSVPDLETARLMKSFFAHLAQGKTKSAALREAQLERIASRRDRYEAAHPFYWAAFTVTGS